MLGAVICEAVRLRAELALQVCSEYNIKYHSHYLVYSTTFHYNLLIIRRCLLRKYSKLIVDEIIEESYKLFYQSVEIAFGAKARKFSEESYLFADVSCSPNLDLFFDFNDPMRGLENITQEFLCEISPKIDEYWKQEFSILEKTAIFSNFSLWMDNDIFFTAYKLCPSSPKMDKLCTYLEEEFLKNYIHT